ncbi:MAG TPA: DUF2127 domain-containing protein, partial [Nitrospira sp.]|nr:DUF2127 domain-containing protein [Nitrospira sp.]
MTMQERLRLTPVRREFLFRLSVSLKGLNAILEITGGIALFVVNPAFILRAVALLTQAELTEDPRDLVANYALHFARSLSFGTEHFAVWYLMIHGVVKILLVVGLLRRQLWSYPLAVIVFGAFIVYQLYRCTFTYSPGLIALSLLDGIVIWLIWL